MRGTHLFTDGKAVRVPGTIDDKSLGGEGLGARLLVDKKDSQVRY